MLISIITVVFNGKQTIEDTINSVAAQTYHNIEHIIIDGGSTDGTLETIEKHRENLSIIVSEPDEGIYDAMNKGIELSTGDVIGFLNADDVFFDSSVLEDVAKIFNDETIGACYSDLVYVDKVNISKVIRYWKSSSFTLGAFSRAWCPPHPTFYARRAVYERLGGFNLVYKIAADAEIMMRFLETYKVKALYVPAVWVKMRVGGETNKSLVNIIRQNKEILSALHQHGLHQSFTKFIFIKMFNRIWQRLARFNGK